VGAVLLVALLKVTPQEASKMMILLTVVGFVGRIAFSWLSEGIGQRSSGGVLGLGAGALVILPGYNDNATLFGLSACWLILAAAVFFADGGFAIVGPYAAEVWPAHLRTSGMGSAYGLAGIGKILGPLVPALIVGSSNFVRPDAPAPQIPIACLYLGSWFLLAGRFTISSALRPAADRSRRSIAISAEACSQANQPPLYSRSLIKVVHSIKRGDGNRKPHRRCCSCAFP